jgi:hypothetical protein
MSSEEFEEEEFEEEIEELEEEFEVLEDEDELEILEDDEVFEEEEYEDIEVDDNVDSTMTYAATSEVAGGGGEMQMQRAAKLTRGRSKIARQQSRGRIV